MNTEILRIDSGSPRQVYVKKTADIIRKGGIAALPTETVYGLAVNADDKSALKRLYAVKRRPDTKPFTVQIADCGQLNDYIDNVPAGLKAILDKFWPGPLTIIVNGKSSKVGLRIPDNKVTLAIIAEAAMPLAVTSANLSGGKAASSAQEVLRIFNGLIDLVVDDGQAVLGVESTVLDCTSSPFKILRRGAISEELENYSNLVRK